MPDEVAREDLCRSAPFEVRATDDESGDGLGIDGITAVYETIAPIDSWEGQFDEENAFGAFGRSVRARMPKLQFDHGFHPLIGSLPIGRWVSMTEEQGIGLHTVGRLHDNWLVEPVRDAIREGSVDGMSYRFTPVREDWYEIPPGMRTTTIEKIPTDQKRRLRTDAEISQLQSRGDGTLRRVHREVRITEAGPVVWPAYQQTSVGVRSQVVIDLKRLTEPDQRKTLAHAVFLADAANRTTEDPPDGPQITDETPGEHSAPADPQATDPTPEEHPSATARRLRDRIRAAATAHKGYLLTIEGD